MDRKTLINSLLKTLDSFDIDTLRALYNVALRMASKGEK